MEKSNPLSGAFVARDESKPPFAVSVIIPHITINGAAVKPKSADGIATISLEYI